MMINIARRDEVYMNDFYESFFKDNVPNTKEVFKKHYARNKMGNLKIFVIQTVLLIVFLIIMTVAHFKNMAELQQINNLLESKEDNIVHKMYTRELDVLNQLYWYNSLYSFSSIKAKFRSLTDSITLNRLMLDIVPQLYHLTEEHIKNSLKLQNLEALIESLRIYSMFHGIEPFNQSIFRDYYLNSYPVLAFEPKRLHFILNNITSELVSKFKFRLDPDRELYSMVINELNQSSVVQQMFYNSIMNSLKDKPAYNLCSRLSDKYNLFDEELCTISIPYIYTKEGYLNYIKEYKKLLKKIQDLTYYHKEIDFSKLEESVSDAFLAYTDDYRSNYNILLSLVSCRPLYDLDEALILLKQLSTNLHIISRIFQQIETLTFVPETQDNISSFNDELQNALESYPLILSNKINDYIGLESVDKKFSDEAKDLLMKHLKGLTALVAEILSEPNINEACFDRLRILADQEGESPLKKAYASALLLPFPVEQVYTKLIDNLEELLYRHAIEHINRQWETLYYFYLEKIARLYPFDINNNADQVALKDFSTFFAKEGMLDSFCSKYLTLKKLSISEGGKQLLQFANLVKTNWFTKDGKLQVQFSIIPIKLDPKIQQVDLLIGGNELKFTNSELNPHSINWPGVKNNSGHVKVEFITKKGHHYGISHIGTWAWYKLLELDQKHGHIGSSELLDTSSNILKSSFGNFEFEIHFSPNIPLLDITKIKLSEHILLQHYIGENYDK